MSSQQSGYSDVPKGTGQWSSGSVVREIEGHFNKHNEPKDAAPIDHTGGVPGVDYKQRAKDALTGHHGSSSTTQDSSRHSGGLGSDTTTGLGGSSNTHSGTGLGSHSDTGLGSGNTSTGTGLSSTGGSTGLSSGSGSSGAGVLGSSGLGSSGRTGVNESDRLGSDNLASNNPTGHGGVGSSLTPGGERGGENRGVGSTVTGLSEGHETLSGGNRGASSGLGSTATGLSSGTAGTATTGATHGISERAEHDLQSVGGNRGNTGDLSGSGVRTGDHVGSGTTTGTAGRGGIQQELSQSVGRGGAVGGAGAGTTGGMLGPGAVAGGEKHTGDVAGGRSSLEGNRTGVTDHNTSSTGTASPKKEGLLAKVKHVLHKE